MSLFVTLLERTGRGDSDQWPAFLGFGPTARDSSAQPIGLGEARTRFLRPNGVRCRLIPHVFFIEFDLIPFQQPPVFILKCHLLVMPRLVADVGHDRIRIRLADGKKLHIRTANENPKKPFPCF